MSMRVRELMDALRRFDPDMEVAVRTHTGFLRLKDIEPSEFNLATIDVRFSNRIRDEPEDDTRIDA